MNFPVGSEVVTTNTNRSYVKGWQGKVVQVDAEEPTHLVSFERAVGGLWTHSYDLKLVEPAKHEFKVGDKVEVLESSTWHEVGPGEVTEVESDIMRVLQPQHDNGVGFWVLPKDVRPLVEEPAPKTEKKKATLVDNDNKPQIGDTIVAFWENHGVEYRQKGVVARIDSDGTLATAERNHINVASGAHSYSYGGFAPHVYIVERAPKPEPVKVDPNQKWIDAPIGSIAKHTSRDFVWRKTANNEWSLLTRSGDVIRDRNDSTVGARAVLFTP